MDSEARRADEFRERAMRERMNERRGWDREVTWGVGEVRMSRSSTVGVDDQNEGPTHSLND